MSDHRDEASGEPGGDPILVERDGPVATVVLNRPKQLNAMTRAMWERLGPVFDMLSADDDLRCVVLRGAGDRAFCPGADISEFGKARATAAQARDYGEILRRTLHAIRDCRHPTVAMIHGPCTGGGLELAVMCDLRVAGGRARFGIPINRIGVVLGYPEFEALIDLVGRATALEILLEGRVFGAEEARAKGLVTRVVPDAELAAEVARTVARIADGSPLSNRWHKRFARRLADPAPLGEAEYGEPYAAVEHEDYAIGTAAFLAKEKPRFTGR